MPISLQGKFPSFNKKNIPIRPTDVAYKFSTPAQQINANTSQVMGIALSKALLI
ncbi:hypothetical protein [Trichodesmium erythraeum]|uniref:hypothetical protein n=1 Tax=Trichodesmium erythraeum TaxID=1206 RepID=UPI00003C9BBE|nr:hypothetical protein [Trichodesmium sp. St11_bin5]MDT9342463.1 hypothetical protein [Trichodesmium erythraeum 21-75]